jgi:ribose 5-phosphate isomerase A
MKQENCNQELKKLVGDAAAQLVEDGMICGIGTGSTVAFFIEGLARRIKEEGLGITGVPTSFQSRLFCRRHGIPIIAAQDCAVLDLAVDGADEVDGELNAIKGGGAAHTLEKVIASMARKFVLIIDESKLAPRLGCTAPVPIEVIPAAIKYVSETIIRLDGDPQLRMGINKDGPVVTDNGQFVIDAKFKTGVDLREIDHCLHFTPGVVETGLFFDLASQVLVGSAAGMTVKNLQKKNTGGHSPRSR